MDVPDKAVVEYLEGTAPEGSPQAEFAALEALRALLADDALWGEPSSEPAPRTRESGALH